MEQYIPKSVVLAEIDRLYEGHWSTAYRDDVALVLEDLEDFIDTLEVKEVGVDFGDPKEDKNAKCIIDTKPFEVEDVDFHKELLSFYRHTDDSGSEIALAKYFYSLGLKAQKGE